jgi:hypothetical protein
LEQPILKELLEKRPPAVEVVSRTLDTTKKQFSIAEQRYSIAVQYRDRWTRRSGDKIRGQPPNSF